MIQALSGECLLNNAMHNAAAANFLSFEGLQRLIHEKKELTSERNQLLGAVLAATEREAATTEKVTNLEITLNSKIEELAVVGAKHSHLEEKYKKTIDHNKLFSSTVRDLDVRLKSSRSSRESLSAEVTRLKEELKHRAASLVVEKTYAMYNMSRKTLEEAKAGFIDLDAEIAKARELELAAKNGLPRQSDAPGSSDSGSEFSKIEEGSEGDDAEDQTGENTEPSVDLPTSPGNADTSLPPCSGGAAFSFSFLLPILNFYRFGFRVFAN
ncbi:uncharacterized protein [Nicotiana tomentosiformis]|uniref:uncharacterized protein n=1 Tax=Nicotiana tomentosiformis TaxID=4098 RepID=UPI00388C66BE